jgi:hypothetical protein
MTALAPVQQSCRDFSVILRRVRSTRLEGFRDLSVILRRVRSTRLEGRE